MPDILGGIGRGLSALGRAFPQIGRVAANLAAVYGQPTAANLYALHDQEARLQRNEELRQNEDARQAESHAAQMEMSRRQLSVPLPGSPEDIQRQIANAKALAAAGLGGQLIVTPGGDAYERLPTGEIRPARFSDPSAAPEAPGAELLTPTARAAQAGQAVPSWQLPLPARPLQGVPPTPSAAAFPRMPAPPPAVTPQIGPAPPPGSIETPTGTTVPPPLPPAPPSAAAQPTQQGILNLGARRAAQVNYDQGIPVSITVPGRADPYIINDPSMPEQYKPLAQSALAAHQQRVREASDTQARAFAAASERQNVRQQAAFAQQEKMFRQRQEALTSATKTMIEAAPTVMKMSARINPLIDKLEASLGPGAGRWSEFWAGKVGADNPEYVRIRTDVGLLRTLLMRMHVGARGGQQMLVYFKDLIDSGKQSPDNMRAALAEIDMYAGDLIEKGRAGGMSPNVLEPGQQQKKWNAQKGVYE